MINQFFLSFMIVFCASTTFSLAADGAGKEKKCLEAYGQKKCGYDCIEAYGTIKCGTKPEHNCVEAYGKIKCGLNCREHFGNIKCES